MAEVIRKATNRWTKGLVMDFSPENTRNEVLTHALNATLLTFNGNEMSLQNDMGNARVETAYLPEGYIPVGTCEYGGIIYIVSYNPLEDKSQIGCFPSPERNVSGEELGKSNVTITKENFQECDINGNPTGNLKNPTKYALLKEDNLNPGDKFLIFANDNIYEEQLVDLKLKSTLVENPMIALNVVSIEDSGKIIYLNSTLRNYTTGTGYSYHIIGTEDPGDSESRQKDIDSYRNVLGSGYNVFRSKTSGKLAILAELLTIDSYSVTHSICAATDEDGNVIEDKFDVVIHSEIEPKVTETNYTSVPKLKYYFLKKSQGYLQAVKNELQQVNLFQNNEINNDFKEIQLSDIFVPTDQLDTETASSLDQFLYTPNNFDFKPAGTYHARLVDTNQPADFIPNKGDVISYPDVKLASIKIPEFVSKNGLDLPFKYDYTLVPCMNYGKLEHLAVSNTVDFSKLHDFNKSNFTTWKYHIDENQLRLTFGAEIFDTYEADKVDALILEFYDCWGFAGSLTISDKKSYSGNFTKIISLNTLGSISTQRVNSELPFKRNINIQQDGNVFKFKNRPIEFDENAGWKFINTAEYISDQDNDCGVLYSNIVYGVKTYLRRTIKKGNLETEHYEYIRKKDLFLYTLPIYNNQYYNVEDFTTLVNPQLNLILTYRLEDFSTKEIFTQSTDVGKDYISKGYYREELNFINQYLTGNLTNLSDTNVTKYYKYSGTSKLNLEIGLQKEYQDIALSYSPEINDYFTCTLRLLSNDSENSTYSINSKVMSAKEALQYSDEPGALDLNVNSVKFDSSNESEITITKENFRSLNFINPSNTSSHIPIKYEFIVGYKAYITNIRETKVPATTVCALFHKGEDEEYNYEDFGIYKKVNPDDPNDITYLSNISFYNEGSKNTSIFGVCRQLKTGIDESIATQWQSIDSIETEAVKITTPLKFNTGEQLKYLVPHIGKYTFCQPYVPPISDQYNANLFTNTSNSNSKILTLDSSTVYSSYKDTPRYGMVLNTYSSVILASEFISTIPYDPVNNRKYMAFTGTNIAEFNKKLLKTMSQVYVYNPDYDLLKVNVGDISVVDNEVRFISNIISTNSKLELPTNKTLNDYIYFGTMQVAEYFKNLESYSKTNDSGLICFKNEKPVAQITFTPNYLYCGTPESNYLVSTLTYNTPVPPEFEAELAFESMSGIVVKHSDESVSLLSGELNKNALYGYNRAGNNLIQLDVSNYSIGDDGGLSLKSETYGGEQYIQTTIPSAIISDRPSFTFIEQDGTESVVYYDWVKFTNGASTMGWVVTMFEPGQMGREDVNYRTIITPYLQFDSSDYSATLEAIEIDTSAECGGCTGTALHSEDWGLGNRCSLDQSIYTKLNLATKTSGTITVKAQQSNQLNVGNNNQLGGSNNLNKFIEVNIQEVASHIDTVNYTIENGSIHLSTSTYWSNGQHIIYALKIKTLTFKVVKTVNLNNNTNTIINCVKTKKYSKINNNEYRVLYVAHSAQLRGTSLTLNDLYYDPSNSNHRLFVREGLVTNITTSTNKLCFRKETGTLEDSDINSILLQTGPCFTVDNL